MNVTKVLMCRPDYFNIEYSINPWMHTDNQVEKHKALAQWWNIHDSLAKLGMKIEQIEPMNGLPDMTFAGDCGFVHDKTFLASNFRHPERQGESEHYIQWFGQHGYEIVRLPEGLFFEGLGDIVHLGDDIIFGYGPRSSKKTVELVKNFFPHLTVRCNLELPDPRFYHVGLAISFIGKESVLYFPDAFTDESQDRISHQFEQALAISEEDATLHFACNNICVGNTILMAGCSDALEEQLNSRGYTVLKCPMSEFKKSGASLRCLVMDL